MSDEHAKSGTVSLATTPATTTTVSHHGVSANSHIDLTPLDAAAAAENWYISARSKGSFTITHSASASARTFTYRWEQGPRI